MSKIALVLKLGAPIFILVGLLQLVLGPVADVLWSQANNWAARSIE